MPHRYDPDDLIFGGVGVCRHDTQGEHGSCSKCGLPGPGEAADVAIERFEATRSPRPYTRRGQPKR